MNTDPGRSPSIVTSIADWGNLFKGRVGPVCVNKFSVNPSSQYRYSFMSESEECRVKSMGPQRPHNRRLARCTSLCPQRCRGFAAGKPVPAAQRAKTSIPIHPQGLSAGRTGPFVPGGRLTAYRLALSVKGCGYGPGNRTPSPACSTPGATTPDVVPPTPPGPVLPAPGESTYTRTK